jgi:hypothetical protein
MRDPDPSGAQGGNGTATITPEQINGLQGDAFRNVLPESVRTQTWVKDVNSFGDFVKKAEGAQALIGQRAVPLETDPAEKWNAWFAQIGRPEKPEGYLAPEKIEGVPDDYVKGAVETGVLKQIFHAAGLNGVMAKNAMSLLIKHAYTAEQAETTAAEKAKAEATAKAEAEHNAFMDKTFGKDRGAITENGKKYLATVLTPELAALIPNMTDKELGVVLAITNSVAKKFGQEDSFRGMPGSGSGSGAADTVESLSAQMREVMGQKEYQDPFLNRNKHAELLAKMQTIRERLKRLQNPS